MASKRVVLFLLLASCLLLEETLSKPGKKKKPHKDDKKCKGKYCPEKKDCPVEYSFNQVREKLNLSRRHDGNGYFVEVYRSTENVTTEKGERDAASHIYFMVDTNSPAHLYRLLRSDELYHFYMGDPVIIAELDESAPGQVVETVLGDDIFSGQNITHVVTRNTWFAVYLKEGGPCGWSLGGATMSPAWDFEDQPDTNRTELLAMFPQARQSIISLTLNSDPE